MAITKIVHNPGFTWDRNHPKYDPRQKHAAVNCFGDYGKHTLQAHQRCCRRTV